MVKVVCDSCGQQMTRWLRVTASPEAQAAWANVGDLLKYENSKDLCEECYKQFCRQFIRKGERNAKD